MTGTMDPLIELVPPLTGWGYRCYGPQPFSRLSLSPPWLLVSLKRRVAFYTC